MLLRKFWSEEKFAYLSAPDGSHFALRKNSTFIGSDFANDVVLRFPSISRSHALIQRRWLLGYSIVDLDSSRGTSVNGKLVRRTRRLRAGDRINFGTRSFVLKDPSAATRDTRQRIIRIGVWSLATLTLLLTALAALAMLSGQDDPAAGPVNRKFAPRTMVAAKAFAAIRIAAASSFSIMPVDVATVPSSSDSLDGRPDKWLMLVASDAAARSALSIEPWKGRLVAMFRNRRACEEMEIKGGDALCVSESDPHWGKRDPNWLVLKPSNEPFVSYSYVQTVLESLWDSSDRVDLAAAFTNQDECQQWLASQYAYGSADKCIALDDPRWAQPFVNWKVLKPPALGGKGLPLTEWETISSARSKAECDTQRASFAGALCIRSDDPRLAVQSSAPAPSQ